MPTDPMDTHGMTMDGKPAMPILVTEYNALISRVNEAEGHLVAVRDLCDEQEKAARLFELPTPDWISAVRAAMQPATEEQEAEKPRRCAHVDIVYGRCILPVPGHLDCFHEKQPIRIDEDTDEDTLCNAEYPGDDNFAGQLCGLPKDHFGEHRCDEKMSASYTALLRWPNQEAARA